MYFFKTLRDEESNSDVEAQTLTTWHIFWNTTPTLYLNYNTYAKTLLLQRQDYHQRPCSVQKSVEMIYGKLFISLFHSVVWIHAPIQNKPLPENIVFICCLLLQYSNLYLPPPYAKWWPKASHFPSSVLRNASPVIRLLQHTPIWSSYSTLLYLNYYSYYHFPYPVTPKISRFYSPLNAAEQTQGILFLMQSAVFSHL